MATFYVDSATAATAGNAVADINRFQRNCAYMNARQAQLQATMASFKRMEQKVSQSQSGPRILVAFAHNHKDATAIFRHDGYWSSPGSIPEELKGKLDRNEIDLSRLNIVSLGPRGSYFLRSAGNYYYNFTGLDPRDTSMLGELIQKIASDPDGLGGIEGILSFSFGERGEAVMIYDYGKNIAWTDYPPPSGSFAQQVNGLYQAGKEFAQIELAVGGCSAIQLIGETGVLWSRHVPDWPPEELRNQLARTQGASLSKFHFSALDHQYWFICYVNEEGKYVIDGEMEQSAMEEFERVRAMLSAQGPLAIL